MSIEEQKPFKPPGYIPKIEEGLQDIIIGNITLGLLILLSWPFITLIIAHLGFEYHFLFEIALVIIPIISLIIFVLTLIAFIVYKRTHDIEKANKIMYMPRYIAIVMVILYIIITIANAIINA